MTQRVRYTQPLIFWRLWLKKLRKTQEYQTVPLGSFLSRFRKASKLPQNLIDAVKDVYDLRNTLPTAWSRKLKQV